jgi:hypothetical protein
VQVLSGSFHLGLPVLLHRKTSEHDAAVRQYAVMRLGAVSYASELPVVAVPMAFLEWGACQRWANMDTQRVWMLTIWGYSSGHAL